MFFSIDQFGNAYLLNFEKQDNHIALTVVFTDLFFSHNHSIK